MSTQVMAGKHARARSDTSASPWLLIKLTVNDWLEDKAPRLGAALAYYTIFSLAPLLIIVIALAGMFFDPQDVQSQVDQQTQSMLGEEGSQAVAALLEGAQKREAGIIATIIGTVALVFGATGVFVQLKDALNTIWEVRLKPGRGLWGMVRDYFLSFTMILGIGFLLLVLLVVSAVLTALLNWFNQYVPLPDAAVHAIDLGVSFVVVTVLFAMIFKILPDVEIGWRDVWLGAAVTSLLFSLGKVAIGLYLGRASFGSTYGAAGTVLIVLVWTYYSAQILFFGAEFTQVYARLYGSRIRPAETAEPVTAEARAQEGLG